MRSIILSLFLVSVLNLHPAIANEASPAATPVTAENRSTDFNVMSTSFKDQETLPMQHVFNSFGCTGKNITPELEWAHAPSGTKSYAITVYDPDAPTGSGWWHWTVFNIPATVTSLKEGAKLPAGAGEGLTDFGKPGYGGPCPPVGDKPHHYIFTVYAIKESKLPLDKKASGAMVGYTLNANNLGKVTITGMFGREK